MKNKALVASGLIPSSYHSQPLVEERKTPVIRIPFLLYGIVFATTLIAAFAAGRYLQEHLFAALSLAVLFIAMFLVIRLASRSLRHQTRHYESRVQALKSNYDSVINILNSALDLQDSVAFSQTRRVVDLSSILAWQMGLRKEQVRQIEKAAILHDVGKIGVVSTLMGKPGPLDSGEWEEMKRHPELGRQVLEQIPYLHDAADIIHAHHERYDGRGYPSGIKGEQIPLGARIYAVAAAYNAMTSHRPYRKPLPHHQAVEEIVRNAGTQFDPEVVKAFQEAERKGLLQKVDEQDEVDLFFSSLSSRTRQDSPIPFPD
ncbi:MAG TPA: HD domain-containing phosphohydrolase [Dehalococcoidia bacterium]|nr:HD domain-containing phosphohydrolase [Dehalococcoidia bacterium]